MSIERSEVSAQEVEVFRVLSANRDRWLTNHDIAELAAAVAPRTVRATTLRLVRAGIVDQAEIFPGHRYRLAEQAQQRNRGYLDRMNRAAEILGVTL